MTDRSKVEEWRRRARDLRRLAATAADPVLRDQLLDLAVTWDDMSVRVERNLGLNVTRLKSA